MARFSNHAACDAPAPRRSPPKPPVASLAERKLASIFQALPDLFFHLAADGTILDYRAQEAGDLYLPPEQFLGKRMQEVLPPEQGRLFLAKLAQQRATGGLISYEYDLPLAGGPARFEARLRDLPDSDELIVLVRNISERHQAQLARTRLEEQLKLAATVFESTSEGAIIASPTGAIITANTGFEQITGHARADLVGRPLRSLLARRSNPRQYRTIWRELRQRPSWQGELKCRRRNGDEFPAWVNLSAVHDEQGQLSHLVVVFADITGFKRSEARLDFLAHHDPLTHLPNRLLLQARLGRAIVHAGRGQQLLALLFLDLDRFKTINDSMGHPAGDQLLKQVAARLQHSVRAEDTVARLGGDEFVVLLEDLKDSQVAAQVADKILHELRQPFDLGDSDFFTTASIGISVYPNDGNSPMALLRNADSAMYQVKQRGRNSYAFYTEQLTQKARQKAALESELHKALARGELVLQYQPQVDMVTEELVGLEALVRWRHPVRGMVPPDLFIPLAEESNLILDIGAWVIDNACAQLNLWRQQGLCLPRVAVNISGAELRHGNLLRLVQQSLERHRVPAQQLEVEITENFLMADLDQAVTLLKGLRALGVHTAVDDFGTGYSSLAYLKRLPIDRLKIDRSFVRDIPQDPEDMAIARAVIALGDSLGIGVVAEGIETRAQQSFLRQHQCQIGQGYLFSKPLPVDQLTGWLSPLPGS